MVLIISIVVAILFALKWFTERIRFTAIIYYIVEKGYTPPSRNELMECIKIVTQKTVEKWIKA